MKRLYADHKNKQILGRYANKTSIKMPYKTTKNHIKRYVSAVYDEQSIKDYDDSYQKLPKPLYSYTPMNKRGQSDY